MDDGTCYVVLNALSTEDDLDEKLKGFLDYLAGRDVSDDPYIDKLNEAVAKAQKNKEWRRLYMTLEQRDMEYEEIGYQKGIGIGREEGIGIGHKEGLGQGQEQGIKAVVDICKSVGLSVSDAIEKTMSNMSISEEEAKRLVKKYW